MNDDRFVLRSDQGLRAELSSYGARLLALYVPDRRGHEADVVLGSDDPAAPSAASSYFGATCGRFANRIGRGRFALDGRQYQVTLNEGRHHLHGGVRGFDARNWEARISDSADTVEFSLRSEDGDQGYPGQVDARVRYTLTGWTLSIELAATASAATIVNLANHAYWNLSGQAGSNMLDHVVAIDADRYLPVDDELIPTGEIASVAGTGFDLRTPQSMMDVLRRCPQGFDHCFVPCGEPRGWRRMVQVEHPASGRGFELFADQPGVQFYTCMHFADGFAGKAGAVYPRFGGLVFESQNFPDAPNHVNFPSARLGAGEHYRHRIEYRFFCK